jgi:hypothetical protein
MSASAYLWLKLVGLSCLDSSQPSMARCVEVSAENVFIDLQLSQQSEHTHQVGMGRSCLPGFSQALLLSLLVVALEGKVLPNCDF